MVALKERFEQAFAQMPLVAILRGVQPDEVIGVADVLIEAGFTLIEVPLNSPQPFDSIERLVKHCPAHVMVGAGTVLSADDVQQLANIGSQLVITPNTDTAVIDACVSHGMIGMIGSMTPSEALLAFKHGATVAKIFPASRLGANYAKDIKAILPAHARLLAVGGVGEPELEQYKAGGYDGFGLGSSLYKSGKSLEDIATAAQQLCQRWHSITKPSA